MELPSLSSFMRVAHFSEVLLTVFSFHNEILVTFVLYHNPVFFTCVGETGWGVTMVESIYYGKYIVKPSKSSGYDVYYKSFRYKVLLYHCWVNNLVSAQEMASDLNVKLFDEVTSGKRGIEDKLEETALLIRSNRRNGRTRKVVVRYAPASIV